jgi:hypothetical protein
MIQRQKPEWGELWNQPNKRQQATRYIEVTIPQGQHIYLGEVGSQGGAWTGGGSQLLLPNKQRMNPEWKTGEGVLQ